MNQTNDLMNPLPESLIESQVNSERAQASIDQPKGFSGWLLILLFVAVTNPITSLYNTISVAKTIFASPDWRNLTDPTALDFDPLWRSAMISQFTIGVLIFIISIYLLYSFLRKKKNTPMLFVIFLAIGGASIINNYTFASHIHNISFETLHARKLGLIRLVVIGIIGIPYMLKSKRVKNTFIN